MPLSPNKKGRRFEDQIQRVLGDLQGAYPQLVSVTKQVRLVLYNGQEVVPDFQLHIRFLHEIGYYLIECQHRRRSSASIVHKIRSVKSLSKHNTFIYLYHSRISMALLSALEADGVMSMAFKDFVVFVRELKVSLHLICKVRKPIERRMTHYHHVSKRRNITS